MLKIKGNLKKLEDFGFEFKTNCTLPLPNLKHIVVDCYVKGYYFIRCDTKEITEHIYELDTLYDLIKAEMVVKE